MICPECKQDMLVVEFQRIELDYCLVCEGVWFDSGELDLLLEKARLDNARELMQEIFASPLVKTMHRKRKCPACGRWMEERSIGETPVDIDICSAGDGIWFDGGEVHHLLTQLAQKCHKGEDSKQEMVCFLGDVFRMKTENREVHKTEGL